MSAAKIAASLRFIRWTGRLGSSSSEYSELGNRYETFQAQIATAWFLGSDRPLFGGAARLNARSRRSAVGRIRRFGSGAPLPQLWDGVRPMYRARAAAALPEACRHVPYIVLRLARPLRQVP